jgi:hypothetical protein
MSHLISTLRVRVGLLLVALLLSGAASGADMKIAFFDGTGDAPGTYHITLFNALNAVVSQTPGLGGKLFSLANVNFWVSACQGNGDLSLEDEWACASIDLEGWRDVYGADIAVLLVDNELDDQVEGRDCGIGKHNYLTISSFHSQNGFVVVDKTCLEDSGHYLVAHEVGHTLSLEHDLDLDPEGPINILFPKKRNHGITNETKHDVMLTILSDLGLEEVYSNLVTPTGFGGVVGDPQTANAADVINSYSWNAVAGYKEPPPSCSSDFTSSYEFLGCSGNTANMLVTANLTGYEVSNLTVEYELQVGGVWQIIWDGLLTCPFFDTELGAWVRFLFQTPQGPLQCPMYVPVPDCDEPGGGGYGW